MKRFVLREYARVVVLAILALLLVKITDAGATGTYLILIGLLTIVIWRDCARSRGEGDDALREGPSQSASWRKPQ